MVVFALGGLSVGCASGGKSWWHGSGEEGAWGVELLVEGAALPVFEADGASWVEGRYGERYTIRVHNRTARRVEVVVSVDGRDAVDGQPEDDAKRGYVILPWSVVDIDGFRLSMQEVAAFRFTSPEDAYTSRVGGDTSRLGEVRVLVFEEDVPEPPPGQPIILSGQPGQPVPVDDGAPRAEDRSRAAASEQEAGLGTAFGERRGSEAWAATFERSSSWPAARLLLRYDHAQGLCQKGVQPMCGPGPGPIIMPQPRPDDRRDDGYSQPPPGWDSERS